jgi:hypothetical protein
MAFANIPVKRSLPFKCIYDESVTLSGIYKMGELIMNYYNKGIITKLFIKTFFKRLYQR